MGLGDQVCYGHRDQDAGTRSKTEENTRMKERDLACCYCRLSGKIKLKAIVERLVDVIAAQMIKRYRE